MSTAIEDATRQEEDQVEEDAEGEAKFKGQLFKRVTRLTEAVAIPFVKHVKAFKALFEVVNDDRDLPASEMTRKIALDEANVKAAKEECEELVVGVASSYFTASRLLFDREGSTSEPDPMEVVEAIEALRVVVEASKKLNSVAMKSSGLLERSVEIVEYIVRFEIDKGFRWLRDEVVSRLVHMYAHRDEPNDVVSSALKKLALVLKALQPLLDAGATVTSAADSAHFGALAANNVWMFAAWFGDALESLCDVSFKFDPTMVTSLSFPTPTPLSAQVAGLGVPLSSALGSQRTETQENPLFILDCAVICSGLCRELLPKCDMVISRCIRDGGVELSGDLELENHLKSSAQRLLLHFVEVIGAELTDRAQEVLREASTTSDGELAVRAVFVDVVQQVDEVAIEIGALLGLVDKETLEPQAGSELTRVLGFSSNAWVKGNDREMVRRLNMSNSASSAKGLHLDIERVFSERVVIFNDDLQLNVPSLLFSILKPLLKGMAECVRCLTLRRDFEFQQIQLDVQFLRIAVTYFIGDGPMENKAIIDALLDEVLTSASERCLVDPAEAALEVKRLVALSNQAASDVALRTSP
mmetsp:Transcript_14959/g.19396  ORF Transcript_14959/g.19396 Transcript_14959/m.19396 type:complete len:585 (-) Transcript_14959:193-1947(-)